MFRLSDVIGIEAMEDVFPEQFVPNDECLKSIWTDAFFVFDTNILLNLYRHSVATRDALFEIMDRLNGRLFLPHQVGLEFFKNRENIIAEQINAFEVGRKCLREMPTLFRSNLTRHPSIPIEQIVEALSKVINNCIDLINQSQELNGVNFFGKADPILDRLNVIFRGNCQSQPTEDESRSLETRVQSRMSDGIAPCAALKAANNPHSGDGYVWFQILDHAAEVKKPLIFVTADAKDNWWRTTKVGTKEKSLGPHFQLVMDVRNVANAQFLMYTQEAFLEVAPQFLQTSIHSEAVDESRQLRNSDADADSLRDSKNSELLQLDSTNHQVESRKLDSARDKFVNVTEMNRKFMADSRSVLDAVPKSVLDFIRAEAANMAEMNRKFMADSRSVLDAVPKSVLDSVRADVVNVNDYRSDSASYDRIANEPRQSDGIEPSP